MRQRNIGDRQRIFTNNICLDGIVQSVKRIGEGEQQGVLESYVLDNYGSTHDFFYPDFDNISQRAEKRRT